MLQDEVLAKEPAKCITSQVRAIFMTDQPDAYLFGYKTDELSGKYQYMVEVRLMKDNFFIFCAIPHRLNQTWSTWSIGVRYSHANQWANILKHVSTSLKIGRVREPFFLRIIRQNWICKFVSGMIAWSKNAHYFYDKLKLI